MPVLIAGLRVATVSNISLVSVGALIGVGGLGELFTDGYQRNFPTEILIGVSCSPCCSRWPPTRRCWASGALVTPWERAGARAGR